jgi:hypothetical protein
MKPEDMKPKSEKRFKSLLEERYPREHYLYKKPNCGVAGPRRTGLNRRFP